MLITLLGVLANLLIGTVVVFKTKPSRDKNLFFFLSLSISVWSIFNYLSLTSTSADITLQWMRLVMLCAVLQLVFFLLFVISFTKKFDSFRKYLPAYIVFTAATIIISQTPLLFSGIIFDQAGPVRHPIINPAGVALFGIHTIGSFIAGVVAMITTLNKAKGNYRRSLRLMFFGLSAMFLLLIVFNFLLPTIFHTYQFIYLGPLFALPFVYLTALAIIEYELFEIKILTSQILLLIVTAIVFVELFSDNGTTEQILQSLFIVSLGTLGVYLIKKIESERFEQAKKYYNLRQDHLANMAFISDIAHRLKTPLAIIQFKTDPSQPSDATTQAEVNKVAKTTVTTLRNIVQTGKIDAELVKPDRQPIDLAFWLHELTPDLIALAPNHTIHVNLPPTPLTARVDRLLLREALYNLVDNARKFSPVGSTIKISARAVHPQIELCINDHGLGISQKDLAHIFERHFQATGTRQQFAGSAGLGLSLVKWVVEAHGGHVEVKSSPKSGTTFSLFFPTAKPPVTPHHKTIKQLTSET